MSNKQDSAQSRVTWDEIVAFDESVKSRGGRFSEVDVAKMFGLFMRLDENTRPAGMEFPPGYLEEEGGQSRPSSQEMNG